MTLLQFLREELQLTGTKEGCDEGECGACTVLVEGHPMNSCLVLAAELDGKHVLTVEGLATDGRLHPLQEAFLEVGAVQCGYCTRGMLLSGIALLNLYPHPTREQILQGDGGQHLPAVLATPVLRTRSCWLRSDWTRILPTTHKATGEGKD